MSIFKKYIPINFFNIDSSYSASKLSSITSKSSDSESLFVIAKDVCNGWIAGSEPKNLYISQQGNTYEFGAPVELVTYNYINTGSTSGSDAEYIYCPTPGELQGEIDEEKALAVIPVNLRGRLGSPHYNEKDILLRALRLYDLPSLNLTIDGSTYEDFPLEEIIQYILDKLREGNYTPAEDHNKYWNSSLNIDSSGNPVDASALTNWVDKEGTEDNREISDAIDIYDISTD